MTSPTAYRLSRSVLPSHYELTLEPNIQDFTFNGEIRISLGVNDAAKSIMLHAVELDILQVELESVGAGPVKIHSFNVNDEAECLTIHLDQNIPAGKANLHIVFKGTLNDQLRGFYRSRYEALDGAEKYLAATQFEATDARRAFPCWDEPNIKATYKLTVLADSNSSAISNMPIQSEEVLPNGNKRTVFETTPRMSSYLLAILVGDFSCVEKKDEKGTLHRVWATTGKEQQGLFALEHSVLILKYLNDYFGINYPLPKIDHIAVPDFAAGAMENWGAITYRETALLFDEGNSAAQARQRILEVVSHEMAHMWFGDLVTMEWWDDLWLNESFASWMGDKAVGVLYPEWEMWTQFVSHDTNSALTLDGLRNSHPIVQEVKDPAEIRELFDAISYSKGGSVLRMLEDFLGPEAFRKGLNDYLSAHAYANAKGSDLWSSLEAASGKPAIAIAEAWIKQTGYPVLHVDIARSASTSSLNLKQERFTYDHLLPEKNTDDTLWPIPLRVSTPDLEASEVQLFENKEGSVSYNFSTGWLKANGGQTGFFRASYSPDEWSRLIEAVKSNELSALDRLSLQDDAYALMRAGYSPATEFLDLASAYDSESNATVLSDFASNLRGLESLLWDQEYKHQFNNFAMERFVKAAEKAGWDPQKGEGHLDSLYRSTAIGQVGYYGYAEIINEASTRFSEFIKNKTIIHPDMRGVTFALAAQNGSPETYEQLWGIYHETKLHEEKMRVLGALSRFSDADILSDLLKRSMDDKQVRAQDAPIVLIQVSMNKIGRDLSWDFLMNNWNEIDRRYGKGGFAIMRIVQIPGSFTTTDKYEEVRQFFEKTPVPSATRTIQQSLEKINLNIAWVKKNHTDIERWLNSKT